MQLWAQLKNSQFLAILHEKQTFMYANVLLIDYTRVIELLHKQVQLARYISNTFKYAHRVSLLAMIIIVFTRYS